MEVGGEGEDLRSKPPQRVCSVIIFGTALGTEGHTGRHTYVSFLSLGPLLCSFAVDIELTKPRFIFLSLPSADDFFNILQGEQWAYSAGALEKEVSFGFLIFCFFPLKEANGPKLTRAFSPASLLSSQVYKAGSVHHLRWGEVKQYSRFHLLRLYLGPVFRFKR